MDVKIAREIHLPRILSNPLESVRFAAETARQDCRALGLAPLFSNGRWMKPNGTRFFFPREKKERNGRWRNKSGTITKGRDRDRVFYRADVAVSKSEITVLSVISV